MLLKDKQANSMRKLLRNAKRSPQDTDDARQIQAMAIFQKWTLGNFEDSESMRCALNHRRRTDAWKNKVRLNTRPAEVDIVCGDNKELFAYKMQLRQLAKCETGTIPLDYLFHDNHSSIISHFACDSSGVLQENGRYSFFGTSGNTAPEKAIRMLEPISNIL